MRIGITGATGFLGRHLGRFLAAQGHTLIALARRDAVDFAARTFVGDIRDLRLVTSFAAECEAVIHLAGLNEYWAPDPREFFEANVWGARIVAEACLAARVERLVHVSSCIALGASEGPDPRTEDSPFNLQGVGFPYAETKRRGEEFVRALARDGGLPAVIVYPAAVIGEEDVRPTPMGRGIQAVAQGGWTGVVAGGACFIDVRDAVRGLALVLEKGRVGEGYLLAGRNLTNRDFIHRVSIAAGRRPPRITTPQSLLAMGGHLCQWMADHVTHRPPLLTPGVAAIIGKYMYYDGAKARAELGFEAGPPDDAIRRSVAWYRANAAKPRAA